MRVDLGALIRNQLVVMDNLRVHQNKTVRDLIEACGAEILYLPPYSPKFNPIEECWSKFKIILRTIAARTREALGVKFGQALARDFWLGNCCISRSYLLLGPAWTSWPIRP